MDIVDSIMMASAAASEGAAYLHALHEQESVSRGGLAPSGAPTTAVKEGEFVHA
jgi:hypothetical protein